ncbi:hypothetical protein ABZP36_005305 [Zizania latifolia]
MEKSPLASPETAAEVAARFRSLVDAEEVGSIKQTQNVILGRLQDSNAVLTHFNEYSEQCFAEVSNDFASKTRLLQSMKADLDHIFLKLSCKLQRHNLTRQNNWNFGVKRTDDREEEG